MSRTAGVLFLSAMLISALATAGAQQPQIITIRLFNRSKIASAVVLTGEKKSEDLLRRAGIRVLWLNCPGTEKCSDPPNQRSLIVTILKEGSAIRGGDVLGLALEDASGSGTYCYIFEDRLNAVAGQTHLPTARLLAYAMAHELGHLLKGGHSHSHAGIMSAVWLTPQLQDIARDVLAFTTEDAQIMLSRLERANESVQTSAIVEPNK